MTGDLDCGGHLSLEELAQRRRTSSTPPQVYGNIFASKIDSDNIKLYYHFIPKTSLGASRKLSGTVERSSCNFLQVLNNVSWSGSYPIPSAMVNIGGQTATTNYMGEYTLDSTLPVAGNANLVIADADGTNYYQNVDLRMDEGCRDYYRNQWYGQRFLDLRTKSNSELFLAVDSTAISRGALGLFAWTIDRDKNLSTNTTEMYSCRSMILTETSSLMLSSSQTERAYTRSRSLLARATRHTSSSERQGE